MNQFGIGKLTVLNSVAGPTYLLLPTGLMAVETATATWGVLASRTYQPWCLRISFPLLHWLLNMGLERTSVNKLQVTCLLNIFEHPLTLFCYICFAVLLSVICCIRSLPGLKKKHSVLFCSLQGGRSRSVPCLGAESQLV